MKKLISIILITTSITLTAQDSIPKLGIEIGYGINTFSMQQLNNDYIDLEINSPLKFLEDRIENGKHIRLAASYRFSVSLHLGLNLSHQTGFSHNKPEIPAVVDGQSVNRPGFYNVDVQCTSIGLNGWFDLSPIYLKAKRFSHGPELEIGYGRSSFAQFIHFPESGMTNSVNRKYENWSLSYYTGLRLEYHIVNRLSRISVGARFGYQFFQTGVLESYSGEMFPTQTGSLKLDFSGMQGGVFIKISR
jgi:hypothetical protein